MLKNLIISIINKIIPSPLIFDLKNIVIYQMYLIVEYLFIEILLYQLIQLINDFVCSLTNVMKEDLN